MAKLAETVANIGELDAVAMAAARARLDSLTKPQGSLGVLEEIAIKLAGITGRVQNKIGGKVVILMAGDHGVVAEGVSAYPQEVTSQMVRNFIRGGAAINVLARHAGARVVVVDMGIIGEIRDPLVRAGKIRPGTGNIARGPAMSKDEAIRTLETGIEIALAELGRERGAEGVPLLAIGDMGIGNTTASAAILAATGGFPVEATVGRGTGIDDERLQRKIEVVEEALANNRPDASDGLDVLAKVGGFEIGGLAGCLLGASALRIPVVIDGFISGAAALIASRINPRCVDYTIASHVSAEPGHQLLLELMGLQPMLHMNMRLGEGTGAALALGLIEAAAKIVVEMATFAEAGVATRNGPDVGPV